MPLSERSPITERIEQAEAAKRRATTRAVRAKLVEEVEKSPVGCGPLQERRAAGKPPGCMAAIFTGLKSLFKGG